MAVLLPTNQVVDEFHQLACQIDMLDYDMDELIRLTIEALRYPDHYPGSFDAMIALDPQHCAYTPEQYQQFNQILRLLYDRMYTAICAAGLYDCGVLQQPNFCIYRGDVLLTDEEVPLKFLRSPGVY